MAEARTLVMDAVEQLDFRVTLGDVAASTGLALPDAKRELLTLATEAEGHLQVSDQGEIAYVFDRRFRNVLQRKAQQDGLAQFKRKLWNGLLYGLRISFGILMIVEFVLIAVAIFALLVASRGEGNDSRRDDRGGGGFFWFPNLWFGNPFWGPAYYPDLEGREQRPRPKAEMNFLESVYSFLFGDGDPNADLEERRYQLVGKLIQAQGGVIAGEQALPYLDVGEQDPRLEYEDYMLPILLKFDGQPEVSDNGDIVYRFPDLQVSAAARQAKKLPTLVQERTWEFSRATPGQRTAAGFFGVSNFIGSWFLYFFATPRALAAAGVGFISPLLGLLVLYGSLFLAVPGIRWFTLRRRNQRVEARNAQRRTWADRLRDPSEALRRKLDFAGRFARQEVVSEANTIYSTDRDLLEQGDAEVADFRRQLEGSPIRDPRLGRPD